MNKKVLTLCAGFLLAGSLTANAQYCPEDGEVAYRTRSVKAAMFDLGFHNVAEINSNYYYQLQVKTDDGTNKVLTVERDYSTGKLYLTSRLVEDATLTHSLWKITTVPSLVHGQAYSFENKETGYKLTMDHTNALQLDGNKKLAASAGNDNWEYLKDGLLDGCNDQWELYTTDSGILDPTVGGFAPVYSYFHNGADSVMFLAKEGIQAPMALNFESKIKNEERVGVNDPLFNKSNVIVTLKESKKKAGDYIKDVNDLALRVKPVIAGAKVLSAAEINTMIDADGSFLSFPGHIADYDKWADAIEGVKAGKSTKFMIRKPGSKELLELAANPLAGEFVAEPSPYTQLARENYDESVKSVSADKNAYAGYDILLREKAKTGEGFKYLMVSEKMYDGVETGNYQGLEIITKYYSHIKGDDVNLDNNKRVYTATAVKTADYKSDDKIVDPLEARYHWKVTYYPSNDSVVFEPLNASRFSQNEYKAFKDGKLNYENSRLATAWGENYLNTVNAGVAYDNSSAFTRHHNSMHNKAAGVPVALFAMNESNVGDSSRLLTISAAGGEINSSMDKYAAYQKFTQTSDVTKTDGNTKRNNPAYVTNKSSMMLGSTMYADYVAEMRLRVTFNHMYSYLTRATVKSGLYFMNLVKPELTTTQTENRKDGAYIVKDMKGHVVYDTIEKGLQNFHHMPATQWVVEQQPCDEPLNATPTVAIYNREFNGKNWFTQLVGVYDDEPVFEGQLYMDKDGRYFTINHRDYIREWTGSTVDNHDEYYFNCADRVAFNPVDPQTTEGFFNEKESVLRETTYKFEQIFDETLSGKFLGLDSSRSDYLRLVDEGAEFELYRAEGWYPVEEKETYFDYATGTYKERPKAMPTYKFEYRDSIEYGYSSEKAAVKPLYKTFFKVKVKDENLIDNDHTFLAIDNQHKYRLATEEEIAKSDNLKFAIVTLKENNELNGVHGYAIINQPQFTEVNGTKDQLTGLTLVPFADRIEFRKGGKTMVTMSLAAYNQIGKLNIENTKNDAKIADLCETATEAFALISADRKLYRNLKESGLVNNAKKVIDLTTVDYQGNESLYEDSGSKLAMANKLNYLAAENLGNQTKREGFYVDAVAKSKATMPQYLLVVAADSVPAYKYCVDGIHGINPGCEHTAEVAGYVEGRFLVNFNDSIKHALIDKLTKRADAFKADNFVRLGFVEAIHQGDKLFVLKNGTTLASIKEEAKDGSGMKYVKPSFFDKANQGKLYDVVELNGEHNNVAFSFRETGDAENSFLIESNDMYNNAMIGSFGAGAWIKLHNNVPVLTQYTNDNGDHNTGDSTDAWKKFADATTTGTFGEAINQAARFKMAAVDKDAHATANETIATSNVTVSATNGAVVVKGAAGKAVVVTNILGQTLANAVISSDNASISVPAGIVVVAVEGEEAVKVVVK